MNVLITGASGFVGKHLTEALCNTKQIDRIYTLSHRSPLSSTDQKVRVISGDMDSIEKVIMSESIDTVIHLAAIWRTNNKKDIYNCNTAGTANIISFCKKNNIGNILFLSTVNIYLKHKGDYALSKIDAEELIKNSGLNYYILRPSLIYGANDPGLSRIINHIKKSKLFPVFGDGKKTEQPIYIHELIRLITTILFSGEKNIIIDACGRTACTYNELLDTIAHILKKKIYKIHIPVAPVQLILHFIEALNLPFPLNSEQVAHIDENLDRDMRTIEAKYNLRLEDFKDNLKKYL